MSGYNSTKILSHAQRVRALFKEACRQERSYSEERHYYRYNVTLLRARFDKHKDEPNPVAAKKYLEAGEAELASKLHPQPYCYPNSPGGSNFNRDPKIPDSTLDGWHPLERLAYPEYFARRNVRKQEFIDRYEKQYGKQDQES